MTLPLEEKRNRVLVAAYELNSKSPHIDVDELQKLADVGTEFYNILRYFGVNGKNWLKKANMVVRFTAEGIDAAEELLKAHELQLAEKEKVVLQKIYEVESVEKTKQPTSHIVIHNPTNSPISFGANSSQTVTYNNQPVKEIIPELLELITEVNQLDFPTKEDVLGELAKVEALAQGEMNDGKWQMIQSRLVTAKTALDVAQVVAHSIPYWPVVWNFFFK